MKNLILLLILSLNSTADAQTIKKDSINKAPCKCYLAKDPKSAQLNPYAFADSVKVKKQARKPKKKTK
jgi:hypothetical protein